MVFPNFAAGILSLHTSNDGFIANVELQISERVLGFTESRGPVKSDHKYGPDSPFSQREINRFFETTGICWYFPGNVGTGLDVARAVLKAFSIEFGIQEHDLGYGHFYSKRSPLGGKDCKGVCVFDATKGSLRLTERLATHFTEVLQAALSLAVSQGESALSFAIRELMRTCDKLEHVRSFQATTTASTEADWIVLIAPGEEGMYISTDGPIEVQVLGYKTTPDGKMYKLKSNDPSGTWMVSVNAVEAINGNSRSSPVFPVKRWMHRSSRFNV